VYFLLRIDELDVHLLEIALSPGQIRAHLIQVRASLLDLGLEERRIERREHLPFVHDRVEIGAEPRDVAGGLAAHLDRRHRLDRPCGRNRVDDVAAGDLRRLHDWRGVRPGQPVRMGSDAGSAEQAHGRRHTLDPHHLPVSVPIRWTERM